MEYSLIHHNEFIFREDAGKIYPQYMIKPLTYVGCGNNFEIVIFKHILTILSSWALLV